MMHEPIPTIRVLDKLDALLNKNDYEAAEKHLLYWYDESVKAQDQRCELLMLNELAGLYRKLNREEDALCSVRNALIVVHKMGIEDNVGAGTTYINCATVYKAFGRAEASIPLFKKAKRIYEASLKSNDTRLAGLYNNMGLAWVDLKQFEQAYECYNNAITIMQQTSEGMLEAAITYLNIASAKEAELGLVPAEKVIEEYLIKARDILESHEHRNGYYAFVCEKCASVFGYYGHFAYKTTLLNRAREIYARS